MLGSSKLLLRALPLSQVSPAWEDMEDDLLVALKGSMEHLEELEKLYNDGVTSSREMILSIPYLISHQSEKFVESIYYDHVATIASHFTSDKFTREGKLAMLKAMMRCLSPEEAAWQYQDSIIDGTLDFLIQRHHGEWEFMDHTAMLLLWELRAVSMWQLEIQEETKLSPHQEQMVQQVATTGDTAAIMISAGAKLVEMGMERSVPVISDHLETAGEHVKGQLKPCDYPLMMDRDAVVAMAFSDAAKRVSSTARRASHGAVISFRDASTR